MEIFKYNIKFLSLKHALGHEGRKINAVKI